ncbi:MAG: 16S rRNA (cytidine(1402)-2'-O)-methyltransferase [bacterium]|nr:16S rRNA (cytidine(1402)-2'-O)-methyltransferase [Patescibacteria group bacterium]
MQNNAIYVVATPIGNFGDISLRALETLKSVDVILCEDTRVTKNLLNHYGIKKPLMSYHQHSDARKVKEILALLDMGKNLALVTDAGTPGISDPGNMLVQSVVASMATSSKGEIASSPVGTHRNDSVIPIPGASAVITALSISGFPTDKFTFFGFPPHKNKRQKYFKEIAVCEHTAVFYESGHRILKCLAELKEVLQPERKMVVCRELTKKFETIYRGTIDEVIANMKNEKGEFVVIINS